MRKQFLYFLLLCIASLVLSFTACGDSELELNIELEPEIATNGLSSSLDSRMISLNGVLYTLPIPFAELAANGWRELHERPHHTIAPGTSARFRILENGGQWINVSPFNFSETARPIDKSYIDFVSVGSIWEDYASELIFPGNITLGSTYEEVIAAYGTPNAREYDYEAPIPLETLIYFSGCIAIMLRIDKEAGLVWAMDIYCVKRNPAPGQFPTAVTAYETPIELGDDWRTFIVRIDGDLYRLPAPITTFVENGWVYRAPHLFARINFGADGVEGLVLHRDNQIIRTTVRNYDNVIRTEEYGFVTRVELNFTQSGSEIPIEFPGGITEQSTIEEITTIFGIPESIEDDDGEIRVYKFGSVDAHISMEINTNTGAIQRIVIRHSPESVG